MNNFKKLEKFLVKEPDPAFIRRAKVIFKELELKENDKALDVGCGRGFYVNAISNLKGVDVVGIDLNEDYLEQARKLLKNDSVKLVKADATKLPFKDNTFDKVLASEILEHIYDDKKVIKEIYRVLKPGGIFISTVPNKKYPFLWDPINWIMEKTVDSHIPSNIWWLAGIWAGHERLYDESDLKNKIKSSGFKIEFVYKTTYFSIPFAHFILYGIGKNLVEVGVLKSFNRFENKKPGLINRIVLSPIRAVDKLNYGKTDFNSSVNIIVKAVK